jgi:hypothetical protein
MANMRSSRALRRGALQAGAFAILLAALPRGVTSNEPAPQVIVVRHLEGLVHGFLVLRTVEGEILANGELLQINRGDRVSSRLIFHFRDGSVHEETTVFSQRHSFRLLSHHLVQKGPAFKQAIDVLINGVTGEVTVRYQDDQGKENTSKKYFEFPANLANGMVPILLKNMGPNMAPTTLSLLVATPKPRVVKLEISPQGEDTFSAGETSRKVTHYVVKVQIGGLAGVVAPLAGKQPPDTQIWILGGDAPAMVKTEGPLCEGCPVWQIELVSLAGPKESSVKSESK